MFGQLFIPFMVFIVVCLALALFLNIRKAGKKTRDDGENVVDLRDCFNRARYMDMDGQ